MAADFQSPKLTQPIAGGPFKEELVDAVHVSAGSADAGKLVVLNAAGQLDPSMGGGGGGSTDFGDLVGTTFNLGQTLTVGNGSDLTFSGTGIVNARKIGGIDVAGNAPTHPGMIPISQPGNTSALWADPQVQGLYDAGSTISPAPAYVAPTNIQPVMMGGSDYANTLRTLKVDSSGMLYIANFPGTQAVSGTVAVSSVAGTVTVDASGHTVPVSGTFFQATQPVSIAAAVAVTQSTSPWVTSFSTPQHVIIDSATLGTITIQGLGTDNTTNSTAKVPTLPARANAVAPTWTEGNMVPLSTDLSGTLRVNATITSGGNTQYAEGTTVPTATGIVALGKNASNVVSALKLDGSGNLDVNTQSAVFAAVDGAANPADAVWIGASDGTDIRGLQVESSSNKNLRVALYNGATEAVVTGAGAVKIDGSGATQPVSYGSGTFIVSDTALELTQGSTTSGQKGPLMQAAVTTGDPSYTTAQTSPLSLTTGGHLRIISTAESSANGSTAVPTNAMFIGVKGADGFLHPATSSTNDGHIDVNATFSGTVNPGFVADRTQTGTITSNQNVNQSAQGASSVIFNVTGTWTGTLQFQLQLADGSWVAATCYPVFSGGASVTQTSSNGQWQVPVGGAAAFRVLGNTVSSGTATVNIEVGAGNMLLYVVQPTAADLNATVTGTVTATQGNAGSIAQSWFMKITDGSNVFGTTTAHPLLTQDLSDGAPNTTSQPAEAMQMAGWDGTHLRVLSTDASGFLNVNASVSGSFTPALTSDRTATGTITNTQNIPISAQGTGTILFNITGSWTGTIVFEASVDGSNWVAAKAVAKYPTATPGVSSTTANGQWAIPTGGLNSFRVRGNTVASGTATVWLEGGAGAQDILVFSVLSDPNDGTTGVIKAASTSPVAADQALVVALSPNSTQFSTSTTANALPGVNPVAVGVSSGAILNSNASRKEAIIINTGTTVIYLGLGQTPTTTAYHVVLGACTLANDGTGGTFTTDMFKGTINAIGSAGGGTVCVTELT